MSCLLGVRRACSTDSGPEQRQADLDRYLDFCNRERAHQGYRTQGRTPYQTFFGWDQNDAHRRDETRGRRG